MMDRRACPKCRDRQNVRILDRGFKRIIRFFTRNNRLVCSKCKITWRRREPSYQLEVSLK